ncbi:MAG: 5'/3'-nucleotidase SurE [Desulfosarcina sp.]|nr:5'/3'-nucleotidase SurE [Desulfobacterales bacterium]
MQILLTNDDGIYAPGIQALYRALGARHQVTVIAPDRERSAVGHGITLHQPLRAERVALNAHYSGLAVNGTPADCVKLGIYEILTRPPDLVVSGINPGANVGINVNYSGTVAAAKEAALFGLPAMAASVQGRAGVHFEDAARCVAVLAETVIRQGLPKGTFLNINIPDIPYAEMAGIRVSRQGNGFFPDYFEKRTDPRNRTYYWQGGDRQVFDQDPDIDGFALETNFVSVTPIKCDMTDYDTLAQLRKWHWDR